ncbi:MAG: hypothetical protein C4K48_02920 [Candidatus Thorarchaeota archaeon]|nr:MAG: hypothetical protein C4K48_02920 [Candidatus Thorarchaeota archaeon]
MTRRWFAIAKAEFLVLSSGIRSHRKAYVGFITALAFIWALIGAPILIGSIIEMILPLDSLKPLLQLIFPGLMRTVVLFIWMLLLLFPLSFALQEIKIGQWEIFLSSNVRTREIMAGTFLGKIPLFGLIVVFLAPLLIAPLALAFEVNILGQTLIYGVIIVMALGTIWLSNFIASAVQARLGDSSRGNDMAKALAMVIGIIVIIPMYGLMFFLPAMSEIMGMNAFLVLPSTWFADTMSWLAVTFNGVGISDLVVYDAMLQLDLLTSSLLMGGFVLATVGAALVAADRIFTIDAGARTEVITTIGKENVFFCGLRRICPGSFGSLMVTNFKDFFRKAQNLSKVFYGIVLATILPVIMTSINVEYGQLSEIFFMIIMMLSLVGSFPFAGVGFLESKNQLWIIQGAPSGGRRFVRSRIAAQVLICIPLALVPPIVMSFFIRMTLWELLMVLGFGCMAVLGAMFIATGVTALNPNYEDTKSPAHQANMMASVLLSEFSIMGGLLCWLIFTLVFNIDLMGVMVGLFGPGNFMYGITFIGLVIEWMIGGLLVWAGMRSLSRPDS